MTVRAVESAEAFRQNARQPKNGFCRGVKR